MAKSATANMLDINGRVVRVGDRICVVKGDGAGRQLTVRAVKLGALGREGRWSARADDGDPDAPDRPDGDWTWSTWIEGKRFAVVTQKGGG